MDSDSDVSVLDLNYSDDNSDILKSDLFSAPGSKLRPKFRARTPPGVATIDFQYPSFHRGKRRYQIDYFLLFFSYFRA